MCVAERFWIGVEKSAREMVLAKAVAHALIRDAGFEPLEAGGLATGRFAEPFAMVVAELAYGRPGGPALTYRFERLRPDGAGEGETP